MIDGHGRHPREVNLKGVIPIRLRTNANVGCNVTHMASPSPETGSSDGLLILYEGEDPWRILITPTTARAGAWPAAARTRALVATRTAKSGARAHGAANAAARRTGSDPDGR